MKVFTEAARVPLPPVDNSRMPPAVSAELPNIDTQHVITLDSHNDLHFDVAGTRLRRGPGVIPITLTEYHVLRILTISPGTTVSRRDLLREASRDGHTGDPRNLDSHIGRLRLKIEPDPRNPVIITTMRGIGYRLDPR